MKLLKHTKSLGMLNSQHLLIWNVVLTGTPEDRYSKIHALPHHIFSKSNVFKIRIYIYEYHEYVHIYLPPPNIEIDLVSVCSTSGPITSILFKNK